MINFAFLWAAREDKAQSRSSGEHIWKSIWNEHKIITWSIWPYIYAEWLLNFFRRGVTLREFSVIKARKPLFSLVKTVCILNALNRRRGVSIVPPDFSGLI